MNNQTAILTDLLYPFARWYMLLGTAVTKAGFDVVHMYARPLL